MLLIAGHKFQAEWYGKTLQTITPLNLVINWARELKISTTNIEVFVHRFTSNPQRKSILQASFPL